MFRRLMIVLFVLLSIPVFAQEKEPVPGKLSPRLKKLLTAKKGSDSLDVSVAVQKGFRAKPSSRVLSTPLPESFLVLRLTWNDLTELVQDDRVFFISEVHPAKEEINTGASDPTLNLITYTQHRFPGVRGESVVSSVKERLFDTTDIDFKGRIIKTGTENSTVTSHASLMATIMAGAANSSPFARGAAPAATLSSSSFTNLFPDPDSIYRWHNITVQNHSYGTVMENFYGNEAVAYDQQANSNTALLHVFSAGNAGTVTPDAGPYTGVSNLANLTGNFKQAKNILAVSGVDSAGQLLPGSSRGPAFDGRVKPELVAYGEDGSSGAAALVSGAAILVQDAYRQLHGGVSPSSALTKAALLNSAADVGEKEVDYLSGYGNLNAYKAVQTIKNGLFFQDSIEQGNIRTFHVTVPSRASALKLTLVWTDLPAMPNAAKALVNDLDVVLHSPSGQTWLPWVLDPSPNRQLLLQPAQRKRDTLNNVEQITVDAPTEGLYKLEVKGSRLVSANQAFSIAYQIDTVDSFYWTFPTASDNLLAGSRHTLRWQTTIRGSGKVEYATEGNNWRQIAMVDSLGKNQLRWTVPDTVTNARLRLITDTKTFVSDTITISPQLALQTGFHCTDSFLLFWQSLKVDSFRLYRLGEKYLEPVATTLDTAALFFKPQHPSLFYSLAPLINGREGIRSSTVNYLNQGVGCYLRSFYLHSQTGLSARLTAQLGTTFNVAKVSLERWSGNNFTTVESVTHPKTTSFEFASVPVHPGENRFRFAIQLLNGTVLYSAIETVYVVGDTLPAFVYPNPARQGEMLKILVNEVGRYTILLFDVMGKQVYRQELNESVTLLPTNRWARGLYFIKVMDKDGKTYLKKQLIH